MTTSRRTRTCGLVALLASSSCFAGISQAASAPSRSLTRIGQTISWSGTLSTPDPMGCGAVTSRGCDVTAVTVVAPAGSWITIGADDPQGYLRVSDNGTYVASHGTTYAVPPQYSTTPPSTTFQQVRSGTVVYQIGVSDPTATTTMPLPYRANARLAGKAFDRDGDCYFGDSGASALLAADDGAPLALAVRLVTAPADAAEVRSKVIPALIETYRRINVVMSISLDVMPLLNVDTYPYEQVQRRYGGVRPAGIDVVHVVSDNFPGGFGNCIGGVAFAERAFSTGSLHYSLQGTVAVPMVTAAAIAAHEIGHLLGAQHPMGHCVEAAPQLATQPASDHSIGPCTVMFPAAVGVSETFARLERATIRSYVRRFAGHPISR